jgi:hypothetical protein
MMKMTTMNNEIQQTNRINQVKKAHDENGNPELTKYSEPTE